MQIKVEAVRGGREDVHVVAVVEEKKGDGWNRLTSSDIQTEAAENVGTIEVRNGQRIVLEITSVPKEDAQSRDEIEQQRLVDRQRERNRAIKAGEPVSDDDSGAPLAPGADMDNLTEDQIEAKRQKAIQDARNRQATQQVGASGTPSGTTQTGAKPAGAPASNVVGARSSKDTP